MLSVTPTVDVNNSCSVSSGGGGGGFNFNFCLCSLTNLQVVLYISLPIFKMGSKERVTMNLHHTNEKEIKREINKNN